MLANFSAGKHCSQLLNGSYFSCQVKGLQPSTEYELSVCGVTVEPGIAAVLKTKTSLFAPDIGSQLNLGTDPTTNTTVRIIIPAADRFLTKNRCVVMLQK